MFGTLDKSAIISMLKNNVKAHICFYDGIMNHLVPVWYFYEGNSIFGFPAIPCSLEKMRKSSLACFEINEQLNTEIYHEVIIWGSCTSLSDAGEKKRVMRHFISIKDRHRKWKSYKLTAINSKRLNPDQVFNANAPVFRMDIQHIAGYETFQNEEDIQATLPGKRSFR